jgi:ribosome-associated protein
VTAKKKASAPAQPAARIVPIREGTIELAQFLKFAGLAESGGQAKQAIADGEVSLNGAVETRKAKQLVAGDRVEFGGEILEVGVE